MLLGKFLWCRTPTPSRFFTNIRKGHLWLWPAKDETPTSLRPVLKLHHPPGEEFLPRVQSEPLKVQLEALPLVVSICQCQKRGPIVSVAPHQVAVGCSWISPAFFPQTKQVQLPCSLHN